jgi:HEAT repeats
LFSYCRQLLQLRVLRLGLFQDWEVGIAAAKVLARDPDPAATKALTEAAGDNSWILQAAALEALAKRGDPSALPTVEHYMSDEKGAIKFTTAAAVIHPTAMKEAMKRKQRALLNWYAIPIAPFGIWAEVHIAQNRTTQAPVTVGLEKIVFILFLDVRKNVW